MTETVLQHCHDSVVGVHFGIRKTLENVRLKYYWPGIYTYGKQYVKSCDIYARRKPSIRTKRATMQLTGADCPIEKNASSTTNLVGKTLMLVMRYMYCSCDGTLESHRSSLLVGMDHMR